MSNLNNSGEYLNKHPNLHIEDSEWKFLKLIPFLDQFNNRVSKKKVSILDVGGGAGQILKKVSQYMESEHSKKVNKFALDLDPNILNLQRNTNPDLLEIFNEDICRTSLSSKSFDLVLMIDVLEHVENPQSAMREIKRISNYAIFKVPLEFNLYSRLYNYMKKGKPRRNSAENLGHINYYNIDMLEKQINICIGKILLRNFTNVFFYYLKEKYYRDKITRTDRTMFFINDKIFRISPKMAASILTDFAILLVRCS